MKYSLAEVPPDRVLQALDGLASMPGPHRHTAMITVAQLRVIEKDKKNYTFDNRGLRYKYLNLDLLTDLTGRGFKDEL